MLGWQSTCILHGNYETHLLSWITWCLSHKVLFLKYSNINGMTKGGPIMSVVIIKGVKEHVECVVLMYPI
jgi:hypothetical protein